jgi:dTDP-4-amino-4,6-dideoxygalactose transaminase
VVRVPFAEVGGRARVMDALRALGIGSQVHYVPVHMQPYYQAEGWRRGGFPVAEQLYDEVLSLPMYPALRDEDVDRVVAGLRQVLG